MVNNVCEYPTKVVNLKLYECKYISGEFNLHDYSKYEWVDINDLLKYDLAPVDIPLAKFVKRIFMNRYVHKYSFSNFIKEDDESAGHYC